MIITVNGADFSQCGLGKVATVVTDETKAIMAQFTGKNTVNNQKAIQNMFDTLQKGVEGSIWSKFEYLIIPYLGSNINEAFIDLIGKFNFENKDAVIDSLAFGGVKGDGIYGKSDNPVKFIIKDKVSGKQLRSSAFIIVPAVDVSAENLELGQFIGGHFYTRGSSFPRRRLQPSQPDYGFSSVYSDGVRLMCVNYEGWNNGDKCESFSDKGDLNSTTLNGDLNGDEISVSPLLFKGYVEGNVTKTYPIQVIALTNGMTRDEMLKAGQSILEFINSLS